MSFKGNAMEKNEELILIEDAAAYVQDLFCTNTGGHDADHTMRVYRNTLRIAANEPGCDIQIAALAALLHDADDHKLFDRTPGDFWRRIKYRSKRSTGSAA